MTRNLRLWPGVSIVALQWLLRFVVPLLLPEATLIGVMAGLAGGLALLIWWLGFSRASWPDRIGAVVLMIAATVGTWRSVDVSLAMGAMGMLYWLLAVPGLCLAFVLALSLSRRLSPNQRRVIVGVAILFSSGVWAMMRTGGLKGSFENDLMWRWAKTPEDRLLAAPLIVEPVAEPAAAPAKTPAAVKTVTPMPVRVQREWPAYRGAEGDGAVRGAKIESDWAAAPPVELWRRAVGPGWSSFAVSGDFFYTQEQRGEEEQVACYRIATGKPVWIHKDKARFWESNAGPGPRATPALHDGRVYTQGGTGIVNVLDARTGKVIWTRNAVTDTGATVPDWGIAGSPLIVDGMVLVAASGQLIAYDAASGEPRWRASAGGASYSSPRLATFDGVRQVVLLAAAGATAVALEDGAVLWQHAWKGYPIVQPAVVPGDDVVISVSDRSGTRRLHVTRVSGAWTAEERWTSNGLKPYFNDFVIHKGHAYGFDGSILACIDLADGKRKWKGGRYGQGQMLLLAEQDLLLILSEEGELALVRATPDAFTEVARKPAISGKTWNHPVVAGDVLLVRNGEEMAGFRLTLRQ